MKRRASGKTAHLRDAAPFSHLTVCGNDAESPKIAAVSVEVFDQSLTIGMGCGNCERVRKREAIKLKNDPHLAPAREQTAPE